MSNEVFIDDFESGCLCILIGKINKVHPDYQGDPMEYYMQHCTCTRHPNSETRECWDRDPVKRKAALDFIKRNKYGQN